MGRKAVCISLLSHLALFSIFGFSFGSKPLALKYTSVSFWGQSLYNSQVNGCVAIRAATKLNKTIHAPGNYIKSLFNKNRAILTLEKVSRAASYSAAENKIAVSYFKPPINLALTLDKEAFAEKAQPPALFSAKTREPAIVFHPLLPHNFNLYFQDRQVAHVELMFNIVPSGKRKSIVIDRKISSGNLEVDLLTKRYIGRYLFMQQASLLTNKWQTVKIDLSAKND